MKIAACVAEYDDSYDMAANCAEHLAQDVEKCLKIRGDPKMGKSCATEGTHCTYNRLDYFQPS
jgi:hypothetical protein